jgi:RimJ/RimL family protein N-acetyltransferase
MPVLTPTVLTTERLRLRWITPDDADALFAMMSDPAVVRYWSGAKWTTIEQAHDTITASLANYANGSGLRFVMELADSPGLIGYVTLHHFVDASRRCDVGYALARPYWNQRYAGEALGAVLDYAFRVLDLNRIEADIDPANVASARLLERYGFRKEGYMPERWIVNGQPADTVNYGLLRSYWDALSEPFVRK